MAAIREYETVYRRYTLEDYALAQERSSIKLEYIRGYIYMMTGASRTHILINSNLHGQFYNHLRGTGCKASGNDMQVGVDKAGEEAYVYPDLTISCPPEDLRRVKDRNDVLFNPRVVIEILSKSNEDYDLKTKLELYQIIDTLTDIVFVRQDRVEIIHWRRQGDTWQPLILASLDHLLEVMGSNILLRDIYEDVAF